jgi:hypothetical protein
LLLVLASAVILRSGPRGTQDHILLPQIRDSPNLERQVPVFISLRKRVAQLYPQALGSFSRLLRSQGGGIRPHPHRRWEPRYISSGSTQRKTPFHKNSSIVIEVFTSPLHKNGSYSIVACVFVAAVIYLPRSCLAMDVSSDFIIPAFGRHVTILS